MIEKKSTVESIVIVDSVMNIRLQKQVVENDTLLGSGWHRFSLKGDSNIDAVVSAVNADLASQGFPSIEISDVNKIKAHAAIVWAE